MKRAFETLLVLMAMVCLILERSSCFEILVIGLLMAIYITLNKLLENKTKK